MSTGTIWLISVLVTLLIGGASTLYFLTVVRRRDEAHAGLVALSAMSWRSFINLVLDAMASRGYSRVFDREAPSGDEQFTLERNGSRVLLACKHGSAFVLGNAAVVELASAIRMANVSGGILATQGRIAADARAPAALQKIELLDGPALWPELRDLLAPEDLAAIRVGAAARSRRSMLLGWLLAVVAGLAALLLLNVAPDGRVDASGVSPGGPSAGQPQVPATGAAPGPARAANVAAPAHDDAAALEAQRQAVAKEIATLPSVTRAIWSTSSTLEIEVENTDGDAFNRICPLLVRYDALAASRVQLTPPPGSTQLVRFRQCRQY